MPRSPPAPWAIHQARDHCWFPPSDAASLPPFQPPPQRQAGGVNPFSALKSRLVPAGANPHTVRSGVLAGTRLQLDLRNQTQIWLGLWERELSSYFRVLSRNVETFVDVGAGEGFYTLFALRQTAASRVLAFEPSVERRDRIRCNLRLNSLDEDARLEIRDCFVGDGASPRSVTLDAVVGEVAFPCLVKIDIEGGETLALGHAASMLARDTRWIVEVHSAALERECAETFRSYGYDVRVVSPAWWRRVVAENRWMEWNRWIVATRSSAG